MKKKAGMAVKASFEAYPVLKNTTRYPDWAEFRINTGQDYNRYDRDVYRSGYERAIEDVMEMIDAKISILNSAVNAEVALQELRLSLKLGLEGKDISRGTV